MPGSHVLLVEDDDHLREATADALRDSGIEVMEAADGRQGLEAMRAAPPCLVLLDLMMPVMDGRSFREQQLQRPDLSDIPVIVISAHLDHTVANDLNAAAYLRKPVKLAEVLRSVRTYCDPT